MACGASETAANDERVLGFPQSILERRWPDTRLSLRFLDPGVTFSGSKKSAPQVRKDSGRHAVNPLHMLCCSERDCMLLGATLGEVVGQLISNNVLGRSVPSHNPCPEDVARDFVN